MAITVTTGTLPLALVEALGNKPGQMYLYMEYVNLSTNVPDFTTAAAILNFNNPLSYYSGLATTANFLRVPAFRSPIVSSNVTVNDGQAVITYLGQSTPGIVGVKIGNSAFGTNSICYGAALVYGPHETDYTQDLVIARSYFTPSAERLIKTAASELFITFPLTLNSTRAT